MVLFLDIDSIMAKRNILAKPMIRKRRKCNRKRPPPIITKDLPMDPIIPGEYFKYFKTDDCIPYVYDKHGNALYEDEGYSMRYIESGIDAFGRPVPKEKRSSVFEQLTYKQIDIILERIKLSYVNRV